MTDAAVIQLTQKALMTAAFISAPVLGLGLLVGLVVSVFQAATQIHEMSLTFIPKILAVAVAFAVFGQWMLSQLLSFTTNLMDSIPNLIR